MAHWGRILELKRAGGVDPFDAAKPKGGGKGGAPAQPDYRGAAEAQSQSSKENIAAQNWANRPTLNTPWGQSSWNSSQSIDPGTGAPVTDWTQNINLTPQQQEALNSQMGVQQGRSEAAQGLLGQATNAFQTPFDWSGMQQGVNPNAPGAINRNAVQSSIAGAGDIQSSIAGAGNIQSSIANAGPLSQGGVQQGQYYNPRAEQALYQQQMNRIEPMLTQQEDARRTRMAAMGISPEGGSEAWQRAQMGMDQNRGQQYQNAALSAITGAGAEAQRMQGMDVTGQNAWNQAAGQRFGQNQAQGQFYNQAQGQQFGQNQAQGQFYNQAQGQQFGQNQAQGQFYNQAQGQDFGQQMSQQGQEFSQGQQYSDQMNKIRQQQIAEEQMRRQMPLNELNALQTGQQVQNPQMPNFNPSQAAQATQYLPAAVSQGQYGLDAAKMQGDQTSSMFGGLGQLAGTAGMMAMSDRRLKTNIVEIGTHAEGIRVYEYTIFGRRERGVMAQELLEVRPDLVAVHPSGYLMVNYGGL